MYKVNAEEFVFSASSATLVRCCDYSPNRTRNLPNTSVKYIDISRFIHLIKVMAGKIKKKAGNEPNTVVTSGSCDGSVHPHNLISG